MVTLLGYLIPLVEAVDVADVKLVRDEQVALEPADHLKDLFAKRRRRLIYLLLKIMPHVHGMVPFVITQVRRVMHSLVAHEPVVLVEDAVLIFHQTCGNIVDIDVLVAGLEGVTKIVAVLGAEIARVYNVFDHADAKLDIIWYAILLSECLLISSFGFFAHQVVVLAHIEEQAEHLVRQLPERELLAPVLDAEAEFTLHFLFYFNFAGAVLVALRMTLWNLISESHSIEEAFRHFHALELGAEVVITIIRQPHLKLRHDIQR